MGCGRLQLTLALIKPDIHGHPRLYRHLVDTVLQNRLLFVRSRVLRWSQKDSGHFYAEHEGRFFYNRLVGFMASGQMSAHILAGEHAIRRWRELMGPTKTFRAQFTHRNSIRGQFGLTDTRNCTHGADSEDSARREIAIFFPEFDAKTWWKEHSEFFKEGMVHFDEERVEHIPVGKVHFGEGSVDQKPVDKIS
ncbi:nucleoside diphosphate kinase 6-like [Branchiostoma floridae]|uniref:Nucleoside diphosphate kinase 6-like n=1 Tax=Branchiostoma floridae TaxID=7739 RepID=A0A9J7KB86_BRAFL|nr:nucleoside diphosphate kinase 6-like [Branchiostoma floridae]XP_035663845.1 nucleoside diphosphate kinase 6-like [Branchiostoma floridae]XP_035663846.1 nucleoside diphosphate kinase 6-like [Branchiostoma floridae]XP_035663847.1 nucleoside diphosphate kinase 6-like [Branchiostoma floridae]